MGVTESGSVNEFVERWSGLIKGAVFPPRRGDARLALGDRSRGRPFKTVFTFSHTQNTGTKSDT